MSSSRYRNHYNGDYNPYVDGHNQQTQQHGNGNNNNTTPYQSNPYIGNEFTQMVQDYGRNANESYLSQHSIQKPRHNDYNNYNHHNNNNYRGRSGGRGRGRGRGNGRGRFSKPNVPPRFKKNHNHYYDQQQQEENPFITKSKSMAQILKENEQEGVASNILHPPSPPSQSSTTGEIKENIDPVPQAENDNEPIDFAALVARIEIDFDRKEKEKEEYEERNKQEKENKQREKAECFARRAAKYKQQHQSISHPSLGGINENDEEHYQYNDQYNYNQDLDEEAFAQFLEESGQPPLQEIVSPNCADIDEIDENGAAVGLIREDDMDAGMEKITQGNMSKLRVGETLMIMNEEHNTWEAWNLHDIDRRHGIIYLRINGGDKQMQFWSEDLENQQLYRMRRDDVMDDSKQNDNDGDGDDASGFQRDLDYSNHFILFNHLIKEEESGLLWRVKEPYDINTAKALIISLKTGEKREAFLNKMPHTLPYYKK